MQLLLINSVLLKQYEPMINASKFIPHKLFVSNFQLKTISEFTCSMYFFNVRKR